MSFLLKHSSAILFSRKINQSQNNETEVAEIPDSHYTIFQIAEIPAHGVIRDN